MYLTCRTIRHADSTRDYLKGIKEDNFKLAERFAIPSLDKVIAWLHRMNLPELAAYESSFQSLEDPRTGIPFPTLTPPSPEFYGLQFLEDLSTGVPFAGFDTAFTCTEARSLVYGVSVLEEDSNEEFREDVEEASGDEFMERAAEEFEQTSLSLLR
ncbi:hypothetical protein EDD16DRAFT_1520752 [Pisolithus croceorrhizus]|nr:hypothetical protein EDD16DRAFT_1520752 [Pisolithus croceorrhizus]KAI6135643.1 hypothetical protein EV401DRAFT_1881765 [Pisolithus croceorrhizus]